MIFLFCLNILVLGFLLLQVKKLKKEIKSFDEKFDELAKIILTLKFQHLCEPRKKEVKEDGINHPIFGKILVPKQGVKYEGRTEGEVSEE